MIVVKLGGRTFETPEGRDRLLAEVAALARNERVLLVHGGGSRISAALKESGVEPRFVRGLRVTDEATLRVVRQVLASVGAEIRDALGRLGVRAQTVAGSDRLLEATVRDDLGLVGEIVRVHPTGVLELAKGGVVPVVAPLAFSAGVPHLNVNADEAAGALAAALPASALLLLTDVDKVVGPAGPLDLVTVAQAGDLIASGQAKDGMAPKLTAAVAARRAGCTVVIANGNRPGVVADSLLGAAGTKVV